MINQFFSKEIAKIMPTRVEILPSKSLNAERERERLPDRQIKTECDNVASVAAVSVAAEHARKMFLNEILLHRTAESVGQTLSTSSTTTWFIVPSASWEVDLRFRNACIRYACND